MKTLKPGTIILWHGKLYSIKEYIEHGIYQANDVKTGQLTHIAKEEIHAVDQPQSENNDNGCGCFGCGCLCGMIFMFFLIQIINWLFW